MQGQRRTLDSFTETFGIDLGSSTSDTGVDPHLFWNDVLNPVESGFPGCLPPPAETDNTNVNVVSCDRVSVSLSGWNLGESSSGDSTRNQMICDGPKTEHGWSSSLSNNAGSEPRLEEQPSFATNTFFPRRFNIDLNSNQEANISLFSQASSSNEIRHNLNLNTEYTSDSGNDGHFIESGNSHPYRPSGSEAAQISSAGGSTTPFGTVSGRGGYLPDEADGRPGCSSDGPRISCKRKTLHEGVSGQSSLGGNTSHLLRTEDSVWHALPARYNAAGSSSTPSSTENSRAPNLLEQLNPPSGIVFSGVASDRHAANIAGHVEHSQRNVRRRINPSQQLDLDPSSLTSTRNAVRHPSVWPPHQLSSRHIPFSHSLNASPTTANTSSLMESHVTHIHGLPQNIPPFQYNGAPNSRGGSSSIIPGERPVLQEEIHSRGMQRNISEHPMFVPTSGMRSLPLIPPGWNLVNGNPSIPENFVSASRVGPISGVYPSQSSALVPPPNVTTQYSRRLSEVVRRSLYSSAGSGSGVQTSNFPPSYPGPFAASQDVVLSSASGSHGNHPPHHRTSLLMDRQGDGVPLSFRSLAAASGRRSRLLSEIRNVLDIVRRGGGDGLRFEDVLILDQSVFFGVPELHDRHRDMRLDVDNMSYEELLALEDRIGNVNTGLNEETISKRLKRRKYFTVGVNSASEIEPCCVCQEEYNDGEDLGTLNCGHEFHSECIKQWLTHKNVCPICKTTALLT